MPASDSTVEYREIPGHPGYRVGDDGSVWSCKGPTYEKPGRGIRWILTDRWNLLWLNVKPGKHSYARVGLLREGRLKHMLVHRLVLEAFVGPCPEGMECRHLDGDPTNNRLSNLCWGTKMENHADRVTHGTDFRGARCPLARLTEEDVRNIRAQHRGKYGEHVRLAKIFNVSPSTIACVARGATWKEIS